MNQESTRQKKVLYIIAKDTWGKASWETHGFPIPSFAEKLRFPDPFPHPAQTDHSHL